MNLSWDGSYGPSRIKVLLGSLSLEHTGDTQRRRPQVLKITRWVLTGYENSLLYLILQLLTRNGF